MPYDKENYPEKCRNTRDMEDFIKKKITAADFSWIGFRFRKWQELC